MQKVIDWLIEKVVKYKIDTEINKLNILAALRGLARGLKKLAASTENDIDDLFAEKFSEAVEGLAESVANDEA